MAHWGLKVAVPFVLAALIRAGSAQAALLSPEDEKLYSEAFEAAHHEHYDWAQSFAAKAHDKLLARVVQWLTYTQPNSGATFGEITAFIKANPDWPQMPILMRRAEEAISAATPDQQVRDWFDEHPALTVDGALAYGKALVNAGQTDKARDVARLAWVTGNFGPIQEREFLANFDEMLTTKDDLARLDRLLWDHLDVGARQQMLRVDAAHREMARARLALYNDESDAESQVRNLPESVRDDPGVIFELIRYRRDHDREDSAIALLKKAPANPPHPDRWWAERAILARHALLQGHISEAYELARQHGLTDGPGYADAEWLAGWIALRFLDDREQALAHFSGLYDHVATPQSRSRAAYWAGRAAEAMGKPDEAAKWYEAAAANVTTFYGQLALSHLDKDKQWSLPADPLPTAEDLADFEKQELVRAARMLGAIKETELVRPFMLRMIDLAHTPGERALAANLATNLGRADIAVTVARRSEKDGVPLIASGYPIPSLKAGDSPERALVLGLIRQESAFHYEAVSSAGARGLMQLMPATAERVAKALKVAFRRKQALAAALTNDPSLNVKLGSAYLQHLLDDFSGSYILSVAAYNAGPTRVKHWVRDMGDPRSGEVDPVDWIESIPYSETRNYVERVLEGVQIYRRRLGETHLALSLAGDLKR